jgi:hypothetical protein
MLTRRHLPERSSHWLASARDVVEIVAIVAAGLWALYVFVYENRIKPALLQPTISVSATMEALGHERGLSAIRLDTNLRNVGSVQARFLAYSVTVLGSRVTSVKATRQQDQNLGKGEYARHYALSNPVVVYRHAYLTHTADPTVSSDLFLGPDGIDQSAVIFYVPTHAYDRLSAVFVGRFTNRTDATIPTALRIGDDGLPRLYGDTQDVVQFSSTIATLNLWPK